MEIETLFQTHLSGDDLETALALAAFCRQQSISVVRDLGPAWKDKIYFWLQYGRECVGFLAIRDPDEPENRWTVWSNDSPAFSADLSDSAIKDVAFEHIDFCGHCGSCGGGVKKMVFGRSFSPVCGCTFRVDNPTARELPFLKKMIELSRDEIRNRRLETSLQS